MMPQDQDIIELNYLFEEAEIYVPSVFDSKHFDGIPTEITTLVLHNYEEETLPHGQLDQLMRILNAVGLKQDEVYILKANSTMALRGELSFDNILLFGAELPPFSENRQKYKPYSLLGKKLLFSDSVAALQQDENKKRQLWEALQQMFGLK